MGSKHLTPRMFLAREMRRAREERDLKTDDVARAVYVSEGLVRSWEKGRRLPQPDHLDAIEKLYGPDAIKGILTRIRTDLINAAVPLEWMRKWRDIENRASSLLSFETTVIPGLLQTEEYASAVFQLATHLGDTDKVLADRLDRQKLLTSEDDPPTMVAVISEAVLVSCVGGPEVMKEQLQHLVRMADRDNVFVHIVPFSSPVCAGFLAPFVIATFEAGEVAYVDDQLKAEVIEEPENVAILRRMFEQFRADALRQSDSIDLIEPFPSRGEGGLAVL
ncbi:helix-turn-helix domain-containing protein [Actinomadura rupiterrae]|uniref:helix-turn-helix domain-containing protein n=1 Tax=Actinomadura rupiterrae TaxID=559627 RepID=UPI0020A52D23|nr:helix-turn-helix transcriptional regulator [Actinomadura rupiterrae]MCP2335220.1 transcriptional regulator with XRE-family HTH domain [Actinomadura rupiterrae]